MPKSWTVRVTRRYMVGAATAAAVSPSGNPADMSLLKNVSNQNFTFALVNAANDSPMTGVTAASILANSFVSKDGGSQASIAGTITELGNGQYNYIPLQAETNGNCVSFLMSGTLASGTAVPENLMFLTGGLHKNVNSPQQHITFAMISTSGMADTAATVSVFTSKDGSAQTGGGGTITNLGHGQYDYAPTQAETNGNNCSFLFSASSDVIQNLSIFTVP